ncbi:hypothetical protein EBZ38_07390 [bacterium]|nr:hypothetical protein [bacterium]
MYNLTEEALLEEYFKYSVTSKKTFGEYIQKFCDTTDYEVLAEHNNGVAYQLVLKRLKNNS